MANPSQAVMSGSYKHAGVDHFSPKTAATDIQFHPSKTDTTVLLQIDVTNNLVNVNTLREITPAAGIDIDSVIVKDGTLTILNNTWLIAVDSAGTGTKNVIKINAADEVEFAEPIAAIELKHDTYLQAQNAAAASANLLKLNASDKIEFGSTLDADRLAELALLAATLNNFLLMDGSNLTLATPAQALAAIGAAAASHNHNTSEITAGTMADARIAASNITQHQTAITALGLSRSTWVPVVTANNAVTVSALVINTAEYVAIGNSVLVNLSLGFTLSSGAATILSVTTPTWAAHSGNAAYPVGMDEGGSAASEPRGRQSGATSLIVFKPGLATITGGASAAINISGMLIPTS